MAGKRKILVTGGAGFIGSHTVTDLYANGYEPIIVDNFSNSFPEVLDWLEELNGFRPTFHQLDCNDREAFSKVFQDHPDLTGVIHFAAFKAVEESINHPIRYYRNNVDSLLTLLELMQQYNINNLVFSSSCTVYGIPSTGIEVSENTPLQPASSPYGDSKLVSEKIIENVCASSSIQCVLLRYFNPVGAHSSGLIGELPIGRPSNLIPFITQTASGIREKLIVNGETYDTRDGTNIRDYIHVMDLANAHQKALEYLEGQKKPVSVFNVGTGVGNTVLEVVKTFEKVNDLTLNYEIGPKRAGDVPAIFAKNDKALNILKWSPKYTLEDSLTSAWKWQQNIDKLKLNLEKPVTL